MNEQVAKVSDKPLAGSGHTGCLLQMLKKQ